MHLVLIFAIALGLLVGYLSVEFPDVLGDPDTRLRAIIATLWLGVVGSSVILQLRQGGIGRMLRYAIAWIAIFLVVLTVYAFRAEFGFVRDRVIAELVPQRGMDARSGPGGEASISFQPRGGGHYVVDALVNGTSIRFMVDTGASDVVLTQADARRIGINPESLSYTQRYNSANGVVRGAPIRLGRVQIGPIEVQDVRASVNQQPMQGSLLGMSFLNRLSGYEVRDGVLTLRQ